MPRDYVADTLRDFVAVESTPEAGQQGILQRAADELRGMGLHPHVDRRLGTVVASHRRGGVLFNGHLDTVPLGSGWRVRPGTLRGHRLYGRGAADMKAGCVAAIAAGRRLLEREVPFSLLFTTDEETTMDAAKALAGTALVRDAAAVVVGEPSSLKAFVSEKGVYWFDVIAKGRAAHGSLPHLGVNAILTAARIVRRVAPHARPRDPAGDLTINVGRIYGGTKTNVVADSCTVELDVRYPPRWAPRRVRSLVTRLAGKGARVVERHHVPAAAVDPRSRHVRLLLEIARTEAGSVTYGTEMAFYARTNSRTVICGPGDSAHIHGPDEFVDLREVRRAADIYAHYAFALHRLQ